jgi:hypothetical protein
MIESVSSEALEIREDCLRTFNPLPIYLKHIIRRQTVQLTQHCAARLMPCSFAQSDHHPDGGQKNQDAQDKGNLGSPR